MPFTCLVGVDAEPIQRRVLLVLGGAMLCEDACPERRLRGVRRDIAQADWRIDGAQSLHLDHLEVGRQRVDRQPKPGLGMLWAHRPSLRRHQAVAQHPGLGLPAGGIAGARPLRTEKGPDGDPAVELSRAVVVAARLNLENKWHAAIGAPCARAPRVAAGARRPIRLA